MALFTFDHDDAHVGVHAQSPTPGIKRVDTLADATDNMDIDGGKPLLVQAICGTPPITISSPMPKRQVEPQKLLGPEKLDFDQVMRKAKKNKKKKRAMKNGAPAANTIRGFQTPVTSGGEESDFASVTSTPRFGPTSGMHSITSSPALRPASGMGGISNLKQQLEALNIGPKLDSGSDFDTDDSDTYLGEEAVIETATPMTITPVPMRDVKLVVYPPRTSSMPTREVNAISRQASLKTVFPFKGENASPAPYPARKDSLPRKPVATPTKNRPPPLS
jgi:hypothetical protein